MENVRPRERILERKKRGDMMEGETEGGGKHTAPRSPGQERKEGPLNPNDKNECG